MASRQAVLLMAAAAAAIAIAFLPTPASAGEVHTVGDDAGWSLKYPASWTDGKTFKVGDTLRFKYVAAQHTVVEVTGGDFKACSSQGNSQLKTWVTGDDAVALDKVGRRWFVCGVGNHCARGMKLVVNVTDGGSPSSSSPASLVSGATAVAAVGAAMVAAVLVY